MPPLSFERLQDELWCHRYYLRHLCDETRFAEWPIDEPVPLLQAVLSAWQAELKKTPSTMSREEALKVLGDTKKRFVVQRRWHWSESTSDSKRCSKRSTRLRRMACMKKD